MLVSTKTNGKVPLSMIYPRDFAQAQDQAVILHSPAEPWDWGVFIEVMQAHLHEGDEYLEAHKALHASRLSRPELLWHIRHCFHSSIGRSLAFA